jgi:hypothetical protein
MILLTTMSTYSSKADVLNVIYVDLSSKDISINDTRDRILDLFGKNDRNNKLVFISNGPKPYVCYAENSIKKAFRSIKQAGVRPQRPDRRFDIDTLNKLIAEEKLFTGFNSNQQKLRSPLNFRFFLSCTDSDLYNYPKYMVKRLLLTNRLYHKGGLLKSCSVEINFNSKRSDHDKGKCKDYFMQLRKKFPRYAIQTY